MIQPIQLTQGDEFTLLKKKGLPARDNAPKQFLPALNRIEPEKHIKESIKEAEKILIRERLRNDEQLNELVDRTQTVLFKARSIFPFDFFPDEISVSLTKVTMVNRQFFSSGTTQSVYIKDIMDVIVDSGPFFATLKIIDVSFAENKLVVEYLSKGDAMKARRLIEGLTIASKMNIDLTKVDKNYLINHIQELGKVREIKPA